jgi:hypothetical protein
MNRRALALPHPFDGLCESAHAACRLGWLAVMVTAMLTSTTTFSWAIEPCEERRPPPLLLNEIRDAVLRYHQLDKISGSTVSRSRWSGLMPRLQLTWSTEALDAGETRYRETLEGTSSWPWIPAESQHWQLRDGHEKNRFQIAATLDLNRLVFSADEINAGRDVDRRIELRRLLLEEVTELFMQWRQTFDAQCYADERRLQGQRSLLEAHLDTLSGGWLSRHVPARSTMPQEEVVR